MIQLIDTGLQPLSWLYAWYLHVAFPTLEVGNANLDPLASSLARCGVQHPTPGLPKLAHWLAHDCFASSGAPMALGQASSALTAV